MERATWQSAIFKENLNDNCEEVARSSTFNAQGLRGGALSAGKYSYQAPQSFPVS